MTPEQRTKFRARCKSLSLRLWIQDSLDRGRAPVVRIELLGDPRETVRVTQADLDLAKAQLTLLGEI